MKVQFINPPIEPFRPIMRNFDCATESKGYYIYQPYDFLLLSSNFSKHSQVSLIDSIANNQSQKEALNDALIFQADLIIFAMACTNWEQDLSFLKLLKTSLPKAKILTCGDFHVQKEFVKIALENSNGVLNSVWNLDIDKFMNSSILPKGSKESHFNGIITNVEKVNKVTKAPIQKSQNLPRHELFLNKRYRWPFNRKIKYTTIFTAWGCPYSCDYCILSKFPFHWRELKEIILEMKHVKSLGISEIYIGDRSFGLPVKNTKELLKSMISEKLHFSWSCYFHPNQYSPELLDLMAQSGCHTIVVGIESKDFKHLKNFGRHMNKNKLYEMIIHAKKLNINVCGDFILGLPGEEKKDIEETINFSLELGIAYASYNVAAPLPGSSLMQNALESGMTLSEITGQDSLGRNNTFSNSNLDINEVIKLRDNAVRKFYLRPSYLLKRFRDIKNIEHLIINLQEGFQLLKGNFYNRFFSQ